MVQFKRINETDNMAKNPIKPSIQRLSVIFENLGSRG